MNVAIIGCGLIGQKRALSISSRNIHTVCDIDIIQAEKLSKKVNADFTNNYSDIINNNDIDVVIISTPNYLIKKIAIEALNSGKHVLSEKPLGKNVAESKEMTYRIFTSLFSLLLKITHSCVIFGQLCLCVIF